MYFTLNKRENPQSDWEPCPEFHFSTPQQASDYCKSLNARAAMYEQSHRYRVRKVVDTDDDNFYAREAAKNHTPIPWVHTYEKSAPWRLIHIDPDEPKNVRFFYRVEDAVCGKYTTMKMSRFLANYEDMDEDEIQNILIEAGFYSDMTFGITTDAEKIVDIYTNGPSSCMNDPEEYPLPDTHPSVVYSEGDFAVAYIGGDGAYSARAVVCKTNMTYMTIYGHSSLLTSHLEKEGYKYHTNSRSWDGMKVKAIVYDEEPNEYLMPYVDFCGYGELSDCGKFMILRWDSSESGECYCIRTTCGFTEREYY